MHIAFIPYGHSDQVEHFMRNLKCQWFPLRLYKEGEQDKHIWMESQLRMLPFGIYEIVIPREFQDVMLTALKFHLEGHGSLDKFFSVKGIKIEPIKILRKFLKLEEVPKFKTDKTIPSLDNPHVAIIPIGVRYDEDITEPEGNSMPGWKHEAI